MHLLTFTLSNIHWVCEKVVLVLKKSKLANRFLVKLQRCNIYCNFSKLQLLRKKKAKSEVVRAHDDFTFLYTLKPAPVITIFFFFLKKKKKTGRTDDDFPYDVVLCHNDLFLFYKKKIQRTYFYNFYFKGTQKV